MTLQTTFSAGLNNAIRLAGRPIIVEYFSGAVGSVWDDELTLTRTGSVWTSGVVFPLDTRDGSTDSLLLEQGKLINDDKKLYVNGSLITTGSISQSTIQLGSGNVYTIIPDGGIVQEVAGTPIYKKLFIRKLTAGSLLGV